MENNRKENGSPNVLGDETFRFVIDQRSQRLVVDYENLRAKWMEDDLRVGLKERI